MDQLRATSSVLSFIALEYSMDGAEWLVDFTVTHLRQMLHVDTWTGQLFVHTRGRLGVEFMLVVDDSVPNGVPRRSPARQGRNDNT